MSDDARTVADRWIQGAVDAVADESDEEVIRVVTSLVTEVDRLRARVAELETAGDRVVDLVDGESDLPGVVRDVVDDLRHAVRGER